MSEVKKFVLITGANGGMGKAFTCLLLEKGYSVIGLDIVEGEEKENFCLVKADLTDFSSVKNAFNRVREITDNLYAIVHFAGIYSLDSLVEIPSENFEKVIKCNLFSAFFVNKAFFPLLDKSSKIIMITSELAPLYPLPFTGLYGVSKGALDKYAYSLRMELQLLETGEIVSTHGIQGELKILPWADGPDFLLDFNRVRIDGKEYEVESCRVQKSCNLLKMLLDFSQIFFTQELDVFCRNKTAFSGH